MATALSVIGVIGGLALLSFGAFKRYNMFLISVLSVIVVAIFSGMDLADTLANIYSSTLGSFLGSWLLIICLGGVMGSMYEKSGALWRISEVCMKFAKTPIQALLVYAAVAFIMVYGGINVIVVGIILFPLAKTLFPRAGIPWYLYPGITGFSIISYAMSMVPGSLQILNMMPMTYLGTQTTAAPIPGLAAAACYLILGILYLRHMINKGIGTPEADIANYEVEHTELDEKKLAEIAPNFIVSLIPICVTIILVNVVKVPLVLGMAIGAALCVICFFNATKGVLWETLSKGMMSGVTPILIVGAVSAVGSVISKTAAFELMYNAVMGVQLPPVWKMIFIACSTTAMNASGMAGVTMTLNLFAQDFLNWGIPADIIHRIVTICGVSLDSLPWNGYVVMMLTMSGVSLKKGYKHVAAMTVILPLICLIPCVIAYYLA